MLTITVNAALTTRLEGSPEFFKHAWLRLLYLPGNINSIALPRIYLQAMRGLAACVQAFLDVVRSGRDEAPDGNTLLSLFGRELLLALYQNRSGYEDGTAIYTNYGSAPITVGGVTVAAKDYAAVKEGAHP